MTSLETVSSIQREYFEIIADVLPHDLYEFIQHSSRADMIAGLTEAFVKPSLFTASGIKQSVVEVAFDEVVQVINDFWRERAGTLLGALADTSLYGVTLETQRFPSRLPQYLKRLALYFDSVGMVDLLHHPDDDARDRLLRDPASLKVKIESIVWLGWMVRASKIATIDPTLPVFVPLPNMPHSPKANSDMADLAAKYVAKEILGREDIFSCDSLDEYLCYNPEHLETAIKTSHGFRRLARRFADDEGVAVSRTSREIQRGDYFDTFTSLEKIEQIRHLIATTFCCARETTVASIPVGWDPVFYDRNSFLHEWLFSRADTRRNEVDSRQEQAAVTAMVGADLEFLEAITVDDVRIVRENGRFRDLRGELALTREDFKIAAKRSPDAALNAFVSNVRDTIRRFGAEYENVGKERRLTRLRAGLSFAGATSLSAMTFAFPSSVLLSMLAAGAGVLIGGKSVLDLIINEREGVRKKKELEANPLLLLYRASLPSDG